jgi:hypothetical protein
VFAAECRSDAAVPALQALLAQHGAARCGAVPAQQQQQQQQQHGDGGAGQAAQRGPVIGLWRQQRRDQLVMLVAAGPAATCSQKIHK